MGDPLFPGRSFFHGTKANLKNGDLIGPGYTSNYGQRATAAYVYLTGTLNAAIWGPSWQWVRDPAESTLWRRLALLKMIPI